MVHFGCTKGNVNKGHNQSVLLFRHDSVPSFHIQSWCCLAWCRCKRSHAYAAPLGIRECADQLWSLQLSFLEQSLLVRQYSIQIFPLWWNKKYRFQEFVWCFPYICHCLISWLSLLLKTLVLNHFLTCLISLGFLPLHLLMITSDQT